MREVIVNRILAIKHFDLHYWKKHTYIVSDESTNQYREHLNTFNDEELLNHLFYLMSVEESYA